MSSSHVSEVESIASVTVDFPNNCCSSDEWAVAVFVALEDIDEGFLVRENHFDNTKIESVILITVCYVKDFTIKQSS
jgi:hypothetical protein